jgi:hypothetical protein
VLTAQTKVASMRLKPESWLQRVNRNKFDCFDDMKDYFEESSEAILENIKHDVAE